MNLCFSIQCLDVVLEKMKEKKPNVLVQLREAAAAIFATVSSTICVMCIENMSNCCVVDRLEYHISIYLHHVLYPDEPGGDQ